jgi:prepilin-type N-terminal cleavage/methylation domain-containing protein
MRVSGHKSEPGCPGWHGAFTLTEVVIAMMLTGIFMAAAVSLLVFNLKAAYFLNSRMTATVIAKSRLEALRTVPYAKLADAKEDQVPVDGSGIPYENGRYRRTTAIGAPFFSSCVVTVTVWTPGAVNQPPTQITLTSILMDEALLRP